MNDEDYELSLEEAQMINPKYQVGDDVVTEVDPEVFGRLAAIQTKQLLKQKIREAEKETLYNEYIDKKMILLMELLIVWKNVLRLSILVEQGLCCL